MQGYEKGEEVIQLSTPTAAGAGGRGRGGGGNEDLDDVVGAIAQEGWSESTPGAEREKRDKEDPIALAAQAAKLSETGAMGFVGVDGIGAVLQVVNKVFLELASASEQTGGGVSPVKLVEELRKNEAVTAALSDPARMRESDGQFETLELVLGDMQNMKDVEEIELEEVYNLFGLGGPDADPSTSTFLTVEDSEVREKVLLELSEELVGAGKVIYFGGLGKSHLSRALRGEWEAIVEKEVAGEVRAKVESKIGSDCIRNDLYMLNVNTLQGSRPTMNGTSLSSVNHSVCVQNVSVPLYGTNEALAPSTSSSDSSSCSSSALALDLSHLKHMIPQRFSKQGSNLSSAQAMAALNTCMTLDPNADATSIEKGAIRSALEKFLPDTERERMLEESSSGTSRVDARLLRNELIKSSELLQLLQERTSAKLDYQSLNDFREIKITISEIAFNANDTVFNKVWFETHLLDNEEDFRSISSSIKISGEKGAHKTERLDINFNLCESSGSIYKSCEKIAEGEAEDILVLKIMARESSSAESDGVVVGTCNLKLYGSNEQNLQSLDILSSRGASIGKLQVRLEANAALDAVKKFNKNCVSSYKLFIYGGLQRKQKSKQLIPSNRLQIYDAATSDLSTCECSGVVPSPSSCHASVMMGDLMIIHGGLSKSKLDDSVHVLDMKTSSWHLLENDDDCAPGARFDHTATVVADREDYSATSVVFFGGEKDERALSNSVSILEVSNTEKGGAAPIVYKWQKATISGAVPKPRAGHAAVSVCVEGIETFYAFGGRMLDESDNSQRLSNEMICGKLTTSIDQNGQRKKNFHWEPVSVEEGSSPPARERCTMHSIGGKILISHGWVGGGNGKVPWINDLWMFDTASSIWKKVMLENPTQFPTSRYGIGSVIQYNRPSESSLDLYVCNSNGTISKCNSSEGMMDVELSAGVTKRFLLHSLDGSGEPCNSSSAAYVVLVTKKGTNKIASYPVVEKLPQSTSLFAFDFKSVAAGEYSVDVFSTCRSEPMLGLKVFVKPCEPCPDCFVVSGPATISCIAGEDALLSIALHDKYGNSIEDVTEEEVNEVKAMVKFKRENSTDVKIEKGEGNDVAASFVLQERGTYNLHIFYQGRIAASMDIKCLAGGIALAKTHLDPSSVAKKQWHSGIEYKFSVVLCDKNGIKIRGQDVQGSESLLKAFAEEFAEDHKGGSHVNDCKASLNSDGTIGFSFTPTRSGECVVNVHYFTGEYKPRAIEGCPFVVKVSSSEIEPSKCKLMRDPHSTLLAGDTCTLLVQAKDKYGNNVSASHEEVQCRVETLKSRRIAKKIPATNMQNGTYEIKLMIEDMGSYSLHFEMIKEGQPKPISKSPFGVKVLAAHLSPRNCTAFGRGLQGKTPAGELVSFVVVMRDNFGNRITKSGNRVDVVVQSGTSIPTSMTDNGDGTYTCSYVPGNEEAYHGRTVYAVSVKVNGVELQESPFYHRVYPPQTSSYQTTALGVPQRMNAAESIEFIVQARDSEGRDSVHGMDPFVLDIELEEKYGKDNPGLKGEIKDLHNGKYLVRLFAEENLYAVASVGILLGTLQDPVQEHIKDSPFELMITPKGLFGMGLWGAKQSTSSVSVDESLANAFMLSGRGLREAVAGEEVQFDLMPVQGDAALSKNIKGSQLDKGMFAVELRGPQFITGSVDGPTKDGNFNARYRAFTAGSYVLVVKVGRFVLHQCPFTVHCTPDVTCADTCEIHSEGIVKRKAKEDLRLKIITLDAQGNKNYSNDESFHVVCRGGSIQGKGKMAKFKKVVVEADSKPLGDGIHEAVFQVPIEGAYSVQVLHADRKTNVYTELEASPVPFTVDKADPSPEDDAEGQSAAALSMRNLTHKALASSGAGGPRKPNFLERRLKKVLGEKDNLATDDVLRKEKPKPIFGVGLWRSLDYWEQNGIFTHGKHPLRRVQFQHNQLNKKGETKQ